MKYKFNGKNVMFTEGIGTFRPGEIKELTPRQAEIADKSPLFEKIVKSKGKGAKQ